MVQAYKYVVRIYAETVGCIVCGLWVHLCGCWVPAMERLCIYADVGCIYADVGCLSMERLGA